MNTKCLMKMAKMVHNVERNGKHGQNYEAVIDVPI